MDDTLDIILADFEGQKQDIIPILQKVQEEFSYLPDDLMQEIAEFTHVPPGDVYGVATFYAQFRFTPAGENMISVCRGTACHVRGAPRIFEELQDQLELEGEGTTEDNKYTLETVACVGCCALAPVVTINEEVFGNLTKKKVGKIIQERGKENGK